MPWKIIVPNAGHMHVTGHERVALANSASLGPPRVANADSVSIGGSLRVHLADATIFEYEMCTST
ncbi:hypothetical protein CQ12_08010 [Bradyrhizobium jicamae]|uniref:Uncharacterized protein n=1 Tax=Bradyrhizobium jicamae TaxID=280332 RepID=A0A0R3LMI2_9BRAD|nr:hypothetical protein CQ12_08010 [Bradyrhizobium jicamae]